MIDAARLADAREFLTFLAPELCCAPLYIIEHPATLPTPRDASAYAVIGRHLEFRQHLVDAGVWRGPGALIVVVELPADHRAFLALMVHELGHCLPVFAMPDVEPTAEDCAKATAGHHKWVAAGPNDPACLWRGHGADWIRRVLHLHYRALWEGVPLTLTDLTVAGPRYGLSPAHRYLSALGGEPFDLRNRSFAEIHKIPAPAAFTQLFNNDVATHSRKDF